LQLLNALDLWIGKKPHSISRINSAVIVRILYGSGLRISEAVNLRICDVDLINGVLTIWETKYDKDRLAPMSKSLIAACQKHFDAFLKNSDTKDFFFSPNGGKRKYSTQAIYNIFRDALFESGIPHRGKGLDRRLHDLRHTFAVHSLKQMADNGVDIYTTLPKKFSSHCLRHSKAMHLLQSGVNLIYIRDFLGHVDISTTEVYAKADPEMKRNALEKAYMQLAPETVPVWQNDTELLSWLKALGKK